MNSFGDWCKNNNREDLLNRWDYELNNISPFNIAYKSNKKFYFKCPRGIHESELQNIQYFPCGKSHVMYCTKCRSFAQNYIDIFGQELFNKIWDTNNTEDPWTLPSHSNKKIKIICKNNPQHKYEQLTYHTIEGIGCKYCTNQESFYDEKTLANLFPNIIFDVWSEKNEKTPYDYTSNQKVDLWWKCENYIHDDYKGKLISRQQRGFKCPLCAKKGFPLNDLIGKNFGHLTALKIDTEKTKKSPKTYWLCQCDCGKITSVSRSSLINNRTKSCNDYSKHRSGENSPCWKGGLTNQIQLARGKKDYKEWQTKVYKKDWYTCQCCGKSKNIIKNAHHMKNFSTNISERYDVNNGITLCEECHYTTIYDSFHYIYGTKNNTPQQLEEYINYKRKKLGIDIIFSLELYLKGNILKPNIIEEAPE